MVFVKNEILRVYSGGEYNRALVPSHPMASKNGYVIEHRVIVENNIGRYLNNNEIVHHKNGKKKDNKIENLEVLTIGQHNRLHSRGRTFVKLLCPCCEKLFERRKGNTHLSKPQAETFCSRVCSGAGRRHNKNNVIRIYKKGIF